MTLEETAKRIAVLRELREHHEKQAELLGSTIHELGEALFKQFMNSSTNQIRVSAECFKDGQERIITPDTKFKPTVLDQPGLLAWLNETGHGSLIKPTVHPKTLEAFINEQKEKNLSMPPEQILKVFTVETVNCRRAPKKTTESKPASK
jgi:hypothetical protein